MATKTLPKTAATRKRVKAAKCTHKTKANKRCPNAPLTGKDYCIGHAPREVKDSLGFAGSQPGSGRPRKPHAIEILKERIERDIDAVLNPLWAALKATKSVVISEGGNTSTAHQYTVEVPDYPTRIAAARELLDRGYGKSKSISETTVITRDAIEQSIIDMEAEMSEDDQVAA